MKKLLALMLCVMLLVGLIPAYAYAEPTAEAMATLYDKTYGHPFHYDDYFDENGEVIAEGYYETTTLLEEYAVMAGAYAARMYVDGMRSLSNSLDLDGVAANLRAAGDDFKDILEYLLFNASWYSVGGEYLKYTINKFEVSGIRSPLDYSGLYQILIDAGFFEYDLEVIGAAISANAAIKTDELAADAAAKCDEIAADVLAKADAAMNAALRDVPAPLA